MKNVIEGVIASGDIFANPDNLATVDGIPVDKLLGVMVGVTIRECCVPTEDFRKQAEKAGLYEECLPEDPKPKDAFATAMRVVERKHEEIIAGLGHVRIEYKVDTPHNTKWTTISERVFGHQEGGSDYDNIVRERVLFNVRRKTEKSDGIEAGIILEPYDGDVNEPDLEIYMYNAILTEYNTMCGSFNANYIRRALRRYIRDNDGVPYTVANGGTFFLPITALGGIERWETIIEWLRSGEYDRGDRRRLGGSSRLVVKAVLNTQKEKLFVMEDVQQELARRHKDWLSAQLRQLKDAPDEKLREEMLSKRIARREELNTDLIDKYRDLLGEEISYELHQDDIAQVRDFKFSDGTKPSARLQGMFDELLDVEVLPVPED